MHTFFYLYTIVLTVYLAAGAATKIVMKYTGRYDEIPIPVQKEELITIPFMGLACVGMYGYLEGVTIIGQLFWQVYILLLILLSVVGFWMPKLVWMRSKISSKAYYIVNAAGLIICLPIYYILITYAFVAYPVGSHP